VNDGEPLDSLKIQKEHIEKELYYINQ